MVLTLGSAAASSSKTYDHVGAVVANLLESAAFNETSKRPGAALTVQARTGGHHNAQSLAKKWKFSKSMITPQ